MMKPKRALEKLNSPNLPNLYLLGFMGTGKSVLGRRLSARLGLRFLDSDAEIEKKNAMSIKDIFAKKGELAFRQMERDFMESGHPQSGCVISCGGGLVCREGMPELVKSKGISIVLFAEPEVIFKRVQGSGKRPLLNVSDPLSRIRELMEARRKFYSRAGICVGSMGRIEDVENRIARIYLERVRKLENDKKFGAKAFFRP